MQHAKGAKPETGNLKPEIANNINHTRTDAADEPCAVALDFYFPG